MRTATKKPARKPASVVHPKKSGYKLIRESGGLVVTKGPPGLRVTSEQIRALAADYP